MANIAKLFFLSLIVALLIASVTNARALNPRSSLVARLKLEDESTNCWDSLLQLQACTGEIILFFINGETYLGHSCCEAIRIIGKQCWPNMIDTLGFTTEEGDILEGYCDHQIDAVQSPPSIGPTGVTKIKTNLVP